MRRAGLSLLLLLVIPACTGTSSCISSVKVGDASFSVTLARTPAEQQRGLMGVSQLPADEGMLFVWEEVSDRFFWMKDTLIPLDVIGIAGSEVVSINSLVPCVDQECPSTPIGSASSALEINGQLTESLGLKLGDPVAFEPCD